MTRIAADWLVLADGTLVGGAGVEIDATGSVVAAGALDGEPDVSLDGKALLPGCVNAHSHVFQRLLRGRVQRATGAAGSFWSWRGQMYALADQLDPDGLYDAARFGFYEMLAAGFTTVGEFHYLHHGADGRSYADPNEMGVALLRAAQDVGIRVVLLDVLYERAGAGQEPDATQRRFVDSSPQAWAARVDGLVAHASAFRLCAGVGAAPHSLRAVTRDGLDVAAAWADQHSAPLHMHVSEQPAENDAVVAEHGATPVGVLADAGVLGPRFTAVHATHLTGEDVTALGAHGACVCVCPTTERDLGDGVTPARALRDAGATLALGTDSHALIDAFEEARAVELDERLVTGSRVVHHDDSGRSGPSLLSWLVTGGACSLGLPAPLSAGSPADLIAVDLDHVSLRGWTPDTLLDQICYAAPPGAVSDVLVGGRRVIADHRHTDEDAICTAFDRLAARLA